MKLLIVESPAKAKTIEKYLSSLGDFKVRSSIGHIRDIPKSAKNAVDIEHGFKPRYEISVGKTKVINELTDLAKKADTVYLATDPDREGEAIAWHVQEVLKEKLKKQLPKVYRVTFNEITEPAVTAAVKKPRQIDMDLKYAQEARRVLDRLVGYDLSGLIWKKVRYGLSAGRVQSPALRILMEREREIRAFNPITYWHISGKFSHKKEVFTLDCDKEPTDKTEVQHILKMAQNGNWEIISIKETDTMRKPKAPFTTSTLQQTASTRLGLTPTRTMQVAQKLYEKGYITYMRTDSTYLAKSALDQIAKTVTSEFGKDYLEITSYKSTSKSAQEAHEAIRPSDISKKVAGMNDMEKNLYNLIRNRTLASQMKPAKLVRTKLSANITDKSIPNFSANAQRIIFPGWLAADPKSRSEDTEVPALKVKDNIKLEEINDEEKQTQPPNRYSEAGLIKELEKRGIGRPSTYASIMRTLEQRHYVTKESRTLIPTDTGEVVSDFLEKHFEEYISDDFTSEMENKLDDIANGKKEYQNVLSTFYNPFHKLVESKEDIPKLTDLGKADSKWKCPECKKSMIIKLSRNGKFMSCSDFPDCKGARAIDGTVIGEEEPIGLHPENGEPIYLLSGRFGPYVQLGKATEENSKPKRASLPNDLPPKDLTLETAVRLLILPRELGDHPDDNTPVIANIGRFGPYVGHGRNFRSLKKPDDPYTVTLQRALEVLAEPKKLPRGVELAKNLGPNPKNGKDVLVLRSKSGLYLQKGLKRIYLPDSTDLEKFEIDEALETLKTSN